MFELRTQFGEIYGFGVIDKKHRMGIPHAYRDRLAERTRGDTQTHRILFAGQWDVVPGQPRNPHIHDHKRIAGGLRVEQSGQGLDAHIIASRLGHQQRRDAARGIAAGRDLAAIGIVNPHEGVRPGVFRRADHYDLVAADTGMAVCNGARMAGAQRDWITAAVQDHEVVTQTVHLGEVKTAHNGPYMERMRSESNGFGPLVLSYAI